MRRFLALSLVSCAASQIPSEYAKGLTVYHVNPLSDGAIPINMDTADAMGDMYFDFRSKVLPIECVPNRTHYPLDCNNQEVVASDLVITKLELIVDKRFGDYGNCNVCANNTASGLKNCTDGQYVCACGTPAEPCKQSVGYENVTETFGTKTGCWPGEEDWQCWKNNVVVKTGGLWYSTTASGYCGDGSTPAPKGCTWTVKKVSKVVNKTCSDNIIYKYLETFSDEATMCFSSCADSGLGPSRNTSSICWIRCFYETLLGPEAGKTFGKVTGVPREKILKAWEKAFLKESEGGCPALPPPSVGICTGISRDGNAAFLSNELCTRDADCHKSRCNVYLDSSSMSNDSFSLLV